MPKGPQGQKRKSLTEAQRRSVRGLLNMVDEQLAISHREMATLYKDPKYPATALTEKRKADNKAKRKHHLGKAAKSEESLAERRKRDA